MLERGSSGLRSPSASSDSSLAPLLSFVPTWKTTEKTTPIPKTISDRFCNYTQRGTPHHRCYKQAPAALSGRSYQTLGSHFRDRFYRLFISVPPVSLAASAVAGELRLPSLKADLHSKYHPDAARPPSLYAECKSIIDGFMWSVQSSPYKYKKEKYTTLLSHCYCLFLCANEGN